MTSTEAFSFLPGVSRRIPWLILWCGCVLGCGKEKEAIAPVKSDRPARIPASANWETHQALVAAKLASYSESDGGGSARLVEGADVRAAETGRFVVEYTAGPLGIAVGGALQFQVSPFWEWSSPQTASPEGAGYTVVETNATAATLDISAAGQGLLLIGIATAPLLAGETITIVYGEGETARVDRYADDLETFHLWVDGDGDADGTRRLVKHDILIDVKPHEAVDLLLTAPTVAKIGEEFELIVAALDGAANRATEFEGKVGLLADAGVTVPAEVTFEASDRGAKRVPVTIGEDGIFFIVAEAGGGVRRSNPIVVRESPRRMMWGDLQIHSSLSDGTASPKGLYEYARDVAGLDVAAVTDHDHHGMRKLDEDPALWEEIKGATRAANDPPRFVTLIGFEWTSWVYGHRHVLYFGDDGDVISSVLPPTDHPLGLWERLRGQDAITIPHHPAGGAQALDWSIPPDPILEPAVEIVSVHGSSEAIDGPLLIHRPVEGHFVKDALAKGYRLGFLGSTDGHDGHPGLAHRNAASGGLVALLTQDRSRAGVATAIRSRKTYATSGERIYVEFSLGANGMGSVVSPPAAGEDGASTYRAYVVGTAAIAAVDVIKNGAILERHEPDNEEEEQAHFTVVDPNRQSGDVVYLRVIQRNGHAAWTSPIYTD